MNTNETVRSVFDCNVLLQAVANPTGPAGACLDAVRTGEVQLFLSAAVHAEFLAVANRPLVVQKLQLSTERLFPFIDELRSISTELVNIPQVFLHPRDVKDNAYVDLAVAANAHVITSRDRHLLELRDLSNSMGLAFRAKFSQIEILTPVELLLRLRMRRT